MTKELTPCRSPFMSEMKTTTRGSAFAKEGAFIDQKSTNRDIACSECRRVVENKEDRRDEENVWRQKSDAIERIVSDCDLFP